MITACFLFNLSCIEKDEELVNQFQIATSVVIAIAYVFIYLGTYGVSELKKLGFSILYMIVSGIGFTIIIYLLKNNCARWIKTICSSLLCSFSAFFLVMWFRDISKTISVFLWGSNASLYKKFISRLIAFISTLGTIVGIITAIKEIFQTKN